MNILIKNGLVIDPANNIYDIYDILIKDDKIVKLEKNIQAAADKIIDAENMWVTPGFIDLHVHTREPGFEYKETIKTASEAAVHGGFTTICAMPNTKPIVDCVEIVDYILEKAKNESKVNLLVVGSITKGQDGEELSDIEGMKKAGIIALSEDGKSVMSSQLMKNAFIEAKKHDLNILSHCEDSELKNGGVINEDIAEKFALKGISRDCEESIIARDIILASATNAKLHICHISTKNSVKMLRAAKAENIQVTAEVCPHHFVLYDEMINKDDGNFKMAPPIRSKEDVQEILRGLKDGTIDTIATDHAPHSEAEKNCGFENSMNGIVGLETALPLAITYLVNKNILSPFELIKKITINPAKIIGIDRGTLSIGKKADINIIDPNLKYKIDINNFKSKSKNSPFNGFEVNGKVIKTFINGVEYEEE